MGVLERQRDRRHRFGERLLVEPGLEDRLDAFVGERLQGLRAVAGRFQPPRAVLAAEPEDSQTGPVALDHAR